MPGLTIRRPNDMHVHFRDGHLMSLIIPYTSEVFEHALVMPNTTRPILTGEDAEEYRRQIRYESSRLKPLMSIQLTAATTPEVVRRAKLEFGVVAAKLYPRGVTTNSDNGVDEVSELESALGTMEECGMTLCVHGEEPSAFCMDREREFLKTLRSMAEGHPGLRIVLEHVTTREAAECVAELPDMVAATITAHHLVLTLDDVVGDKIRPHHFCKPVAKTRQDREALRKFATSGNPKFFFGSDSAPHTVSRKECPEGCAGVFSAPVAIEVLAQVFEEEGRLDKLEGFTSAFGSGFYGLPASSQDLKLRRKSWTVPKMVRKTFVPFMAGETLTWSRDV